MVFHIVNINHLGAEFALFNITAAIGLVEVNLLEWEFLGAIAAFLSLLGVVHLKCVNCYDRSIKIWIKKFLIFHWFIYKRHNGEEENLPLLRKRILQKGKVPLRSHPRKQEELPVLPPRLLQKGRQLQLLPSTQRKRVTQAKTKTIQKEGKEILTIGRTIVWRIRRKWGSSINIAVGKEIRELGWGWWKDQKGQLTFGNAIFLIGWRASLNLNKAKENSSVYKNLSEKVSWPQ